MRRAYPIFLSLCLLASNHAQEHLPTTKEGHHASAHHDHFAAIVQRNGTLAIHLKHEGKRIPGPQPILVKPECHAFGQTGRCRRQPARLTTEQEPTNKAVKVSFEAETKEGVTVTQHYFIGKDRIQSWGACKDPEKLTPPTDYRIRVRFVRTHLLEDHAPKDVVTARVEGSTWMAKTSKGEITFPFDEPQSLTKIPGLRAVGVLDVVSSDWQGLGVEVNAPRSRHGSLQVWNYQEQPLYQGFSASFHKADSSNDSKSSAVTIRIQPTR
ncbi:MAG: hypothetical protein GWQ05_03120 [Verrucomicrobiaceae bacterium]|nr:hypothetical protein [Verrucomicrobiaceae bacterium]